MWFIKNDVDNKYSKIKHKINRIFVYKKHSNNFMRLTIIILYYNKFYTYAFQYNKIKIMLNLYKFIYLFLSEVNI